MRMETFNLENYMNDKKNKALPLQVFIHFVDPCQERVYSVRFDLKINSKDALNLDYKKLMDTVFEILK